MAFDLVQDFHVQTNRARDKCREMGAGLEKGRPTENEPLDTWCTNCI